MIENYNYYCPYTQNKKFETFLEDLLDINLEKTDLVYEISKYVQLIETFYNDKINYFKQKLKDLATS